MSHYTKLKNTELEALLKERGLPTGGKKADMVARLTKDDEENKTAATAVSSKVDAEDEIDWDDEGEEGATEAAKPAAAAETKLEASASTTTTKSNDAAKAGGVGEVGNPQEVPNQKADVDPATTDDLSVKQPNKDKDGETAAITEEKVSYTMGLAATNIEDEIAKRKRRAEKFGLKVDDNESLKLLERAKKFGGTGPRGLDEALPERAERRKRGRDDNDDGGRNKRRGGGARFEGRGGRGNRDGDRRRNNQGGDRANTGGGGTSWMSEADRQKAEARKAKWAKSAEAS